MLLGWWLTAAAVATVVLAQDHDQLAPQAPQLRHDSCPERCAPCQEPDCEHTVLDQCGCCPVGPYAPLRAFFGDFFFFF